MLVVGYLTDANFGWQGCSDTDEPIAMLDFWMEREANLLNIKAQLNSQQIQEISGVLEASKSSYYPAFGRSSS